ncbi:MAG TPA: CHRD domain-containing protein [Rhizomicrobium sp.]|nr:CHRD domain-containing protein [Rhizomicrobium sp.]
MRLALAGAILLAGLAAGPALAAGVQFAGEFDPMPHDNSTRANVVGEGRATAILSGNQLAIRGEFSGLSSPATGAHLDMGPAMGVPGNAIGALEVTKDVHGAISGTVKLTVDAVSALKKGALYVQLDSEKSPEGNSWAWLEAAGVEGQ